MNDKPIILTDSSEGINKYPIFNFDEIYFETLQKKLLLEGIKGICLVSNNLTRDWKQFQSNFKVIEAAGGKVNNKNNETLFIYRFGKWDLPKGHIEKGEDKITAAIREVEEECGISGLSIIDELETTYHVFEFKGIVRLKVTYWYSMYSDFTGKLSPQTEEGISEVVFKNEFETKAALQNTYENIKLLF